MHYTIIGKAHGEGVRVGTHPVDRSFELSRDPDGRLVVQRDGERLVLDVHHLPDGDVHVLIGDRSYDVSVGLDRHEAVCALLGRLYRLHLYNDRQLRLMRLEEASRGGFEPEVRSPMAGKVIAVLVAPDSEVDEQTALVVVEAMKMENIIRAEQPCRVERVEVEVGQAVEPRQTLLVVAPLEETGVE